MRRLVKIVAVLAVLVLAGWLGLPPLQAYWQSRSRPTFRLADVTRGEIVYSVNSTGTVQPVLSVQVGSFVSGPIKSVGVEFNAKVKAGQVLAEVDPLIYTAQCDQAKAALDCAKANLMQAEAKLDQCEQEWKRAKTLYEKNAIADTDYDLSKANCQTARANVAVCQATIKQNEASLKLAETNLGYTVIHSPVDGMVIDRKIDPGQTVASQFQTPELFKVAPDMEKRMFIFASVDEADIGLIREAQLRGQPVMFTVDAYPNDLFKGKVYQVRLNPTTTQNVVTYPVVVESPNPDLKLLPGMTATLSFQIDKHEKILRVPNAALRYYPKPEHVHPDDRPLLEGDDRPTTNDDAQTVGEVQRSAMEKAEAGQKRTRRHVWIVDGDLLRAVAITTGLSDNKYSEVVSGDLKDGQKVVTGVTATKP